MKTPPTLSSREERAANSYMADDVYDRARELTTASERTARAEDFLTLVEGGVPDILRNTIEIRNYSYGLTEIEERPEVRLDVFNRLDDRPVTFEIRTLFFRGDGTVIDATEWAQATAEPRQFYRYRVISFTPYVESEQVQLRLLAVGNEPVEAPGS